MEYTLIWCGHQHVRKSVPTQPNVKFAEKGSLKALYYCLTSKYVFVSVGLAQDLTSLKVFRGAVATHLWHGVPIKRIEDDMHDRKNSTLLRARNAIRNRVFGVPYSYYASASAVNSKIFASAFSSWGATPARMIASGTPRNDFLISSAHIRGRKAELRKKYESLINMPLRRTVVTYMPTFRRKGNDVFSFSRVENADRIANILKDNDALLIEKNHFNTYRTNDVEGYRTSWMIAIPPSMESDIDAQEILLATDILITDYSGCYLDFVLLDRPIIHFAYDHDYYRDVDSGLYFDLDEVAAGPIVTSYDELLGVLERILRGEDSWRDRRDYVRRTYMSYEKGEACRIIAGTVLGLDGRRNSQ